jgi:hypothetical protein
LISAFFRFAQAGLRSKKGNKAKPKEKYAVRANIKLQNLQLAHEEKPPAGNIYGGKVI